MIDEEKLFELLSVGMELQVAYDHFIQIEGVIIEPPFILYRSIDTTTFKADDTVFFKQPDFIIDLITDFKDIATERKLEKLLDDNYLPYDKAEDFIEKENIYQTRYFI